MTEEQIEAVRLALPLIGRSTAPEVAYRAGLPLEATYEALVALHARHEARVVVDYDVVTTRAKSGRIRGWERM